MSRPSSHQLPQFRKTLVFLILLLGVMGVVFWLAIKPKHDPAEGELTVAGSQKEESRANTKVPATFDSEQTGDADADDVGTLVGNTALSDAELVRRLSVIVLNRSTSEKTRSEALAHLLNLTTEEDESVLFVLARSSNLNEDLGDDLFKDALNRSLSTQADLSLIFLERKEETLRKEAHEHLVFLLDQDLGDKASAWRSAVDAAKVRWKSASD